MKIIPQTILGVIFLGLASCASRQPSKNLEALVIAHRGASGYLPEHTLVATAMAHSWNVDYVEPDVVLSRDGVPVVMHDIHLDTTTNVKDLFPRRHRKDGRYYVADFSFKEIKSLKVHERLNLKTSKAAYEARFPAQFAYFQVPSLAEYLDLVSGLNKSRRQNVGVYLELKAYEFHRSEGLDIQRATLDVLKAHGWLGSANKKLILQSFEPQMLKNLRSELGPNAQLIQLVAENSWAETSTDYDHMQSNGGLDEVKTYANGIGPYMNQLYMLNGQNVVAGDLVSRAHQRGLKVHPYTHRVDALPKGFVSNEHLLRFLFEELRVDGLFSDFADQVLEWRSSN